MSNLCKRVASATLLLFLIKKSIALCCMKASAIILAFYVFVGSLFPQTDFSQLPKVVYAFKHFRQHYQQEAVAGKNVSLWKFAELHFFNPKKHEAGHEQQHTQLPLHSINTVFATAEFHQHILPELSLIKTFTSIFSFDQSMNLPGFLSNIFRPPVFFYC